MTYFRLAQGVLGFALIVAGIALWSVPAAILTAGVLLTVDRLTDR